MELARGDGKKSGNKVKLTWLNLNVRDRTTLKYSNHKCTYSSLVPDVKMVRNRLLPLACDSVGDLVFSGSYEKVE